MSDMDYSKIRPKKKCGFILYSHNGVCVGKLKRGKRSIPRRKFEQKLQERILTEEKA